MVVCWQKVARIVYISQYSFWKIYFYFYENIGFHFRLRLRAGIFCQK